MPQCRPDGRLAAGFIREADEVKVFEVFGGDLPVMGWPTESRYAKRLGDRSHKRTAGCR
ncbi:hypothetical protein [Paenibacillus chungangensis]|uniref:Uncharacterized protein n=1 Tax=Paenibacillus chungangensis TaxID=696535 RepID=A0ABW3HU48_9BACL